MIKAGYHPKEEYPIGNGETIDLAIIGKNKKIAIEIETGKSDAVRNIRKCLDAGFEVVSVATNGEAIKKIQLEAEQLSKRELKKVRLKGAMGSKNWERGRQPIERRAG